MKSRQKCVLCGIKLPKSAQGVKCRSCLSLPKISATQQTKDIYSASQLAERAKQWQDCHTIYDLTWSQAIELRKIQGEHCAICGRKLYLVLNHDHKTGKARGYLCKGCNTWIVKYTNSKFVKCAEQFLQNPSVNAVRPIKE